MQDVEKKQEGTDVQYDLKAQVTINKGYTLPAAKLCVSGTINQDEEKELDKIVQRSVLFLIDRSGSMVPTMSSIPNYSPSLFAVFYLLCAIDKLLICILYLKTEWISN